MSQTGCGWRRIVLFSALWLDLRQMGPLGWWPLEDPCRGFPKGGPPEGEQDEGGSCPGPFAFCPGPHLSAGGVKYHEKQHAKGPLGSGCWAFRKMSHLRRRARVCGAPVGTALHQWLEEHPQLCRSWPFLSSLKPLSCFPFLQLRHPSHVGEPQVSALLLSLPASIFSSLTSCRIKSRSKLPSLPPSFPPHAELHGQHGGFRQAMPSWLVHFCLARLATVSRTREGLCTG